MADLRFIFGGNDAEGKMFLGKKAETGNDNGSEYFGNGRENVADFDKKFQKYIIEPDATTYDKQVTDQLYPASQLRFGKYNIFGQTKSRRKTYAESHDECCYRSTDSDHRQVYHLFAQDKMKTDIKQDDIYSIGKTSAGNITECAQRNPSGRQWNVEKINYVQNRFTHEKYRISNGNAKSMVLAVLCREMS